MKKTLLIAGAVVIGLPLVLVLAIALFFAGVMSSFKYRPARVLLLVAAMGAVAVAATRLVDLPIS